MNVIGNIVWLVFGGIIGAVLWALAGLLWCATIIGIPIGLQFFKIAGFVLWPFGRQIDPGHFGAGGLILNVLWIIFFGWEFAITHVVIGLFFCVTIIGIPFGLQHFKLALLGLIPFGSRIVEG